MNIAEIKYYDIANGEGVRVSLFVSGCRRHCKGCFNEVAWDFSYGKPFTNETAEKVLSFAEPYYIAGLSLLGGDPFEPENRGALIPFVREFRRRYPQKTVWCYTGYTYENGNLREPQVKSGEAAELLSLIDILVDGPFMLDLKDIRLKFRGSSNQRVLDLNATRKAGEPVLYLK